MADIAPRELRGAAYGLRQSLDTVGAFLGPLLALMLMQMLGDIRAVFWAATLPAFVAVLLLVVAVREPQDAAAATLAHLPVAFSELARLPARYWIIVMLGSVLTLARFSEAFLVLRADNVGLPAAEVPIVLVVMNIVYAVAAYPAGVAADRMSPRRLLTASLAVLVAADVVLASARDVGVVLVGVALWGLHMGLSQGLLATLVAAAAPAALRGTAFGLFNLASGVFLLIASVLAGFLWSTFGPSATFLAGAAFATITLVGIVLWTPKAEYSEKLNPE